MPTLRSPGPGAAGRDIRVRGAAFAARRVKVCSDTFSAGGEGAPPESHPGTRIGSGHRAPASRQSDLRPLAVRTAAWRDGVMRRSDRRRHVARRLVAAVVPAVLAAVAVSRSPAALTAAVAGATRTTTVSLYWIRAGASLGVSHRVIPATAAIGAATLRSLLAGPNRAERAAGLSSAVPSSSRLLHLSITAGVASADFDSRFASGGGSLSVIGRVDQVVYTLTQFPTVHAVLFLVNGKVARTFTGEGLVLDRPLGRAAARSLLPAIFVERPAVGDTLHSPFRLSGLANTFEAVFQVTVVDATGHTLVSRVVHASAGSGTWGTFSLPVAFHGARPGMARIVVFERSAKDGRPIHVVRIPVRIAP